MRYYADYIWYYSIWIITLATLSVVYLFGVLIMIGGVIHIVAGFKLFKGIGSWLGIIWDTLFCCWLLYF
jgi:uncharacterized membrane protein HdeD (DUF308 family)